MGNSSDTINKIEQIKTELDKLSPMTRENSDRLWKKFRLEWNYNSNHIEGNTLTYGETQLLLFFDKTTGDHEMREYEEMKAHDVAVFTIKNWASEKDRDLTEADIRELNQLILVRPYWKDALTYDGQSTRRQIKDGEYKEHPNSVRLANGEMFHYATPEDVPIKMRELIDWYRENRDLHPVVLAAELHYRFILIHPFDDGNGRIARLLVNYVLMKNDLPPIIIKSADKKEYLNALNKADVGDREAFHEYIAKQVVWSLGITLKAAKGESIEDDDDLDKEIELLSRKTRKQNVQAKSRREIIENIYNESLRGLYDLLERRLSKFDKLFIKNERIYHTGDILSLINKKRFGLANLDEEFNFEYQNQKVGRIQNGGFSLGKIEQDIDKITILYSWNEYKNSNNRLIDFNYEVQTIFSEKSYTISFSRLKPEPNTELLKIDKVYNVFLEETESNEFVAMVSKLILQDIHANDAG